LSYYIVNCYFACVLDVFGSFAQYFNIQMMQSAQANQFFFDNRVKVFNHQHFVESFEELERKFIRERNG